VLLLAFDTATPSVTVALHDGDRVLAETSAIDARRHGELLAPSISRVLAAAGTSPGGVTAVVVGTGPGPYTGLRVGLVTARALGAALEVPVYGVCTLDAIAYAAVLAGAVPDVPAALEVPAMPAALGVPAASSAAGTPGEPGEFSVGGGSAGSAGRSTPGEPGVAGTRSAAPAAFLVATDARRKEVYWAAYAADGSRLAAPAVNRPADVPAGLPAAGYGAWLYPEAFGSLLEPRYPAAAALAGLAACRLAAGLPLSGPEPLYLRLPDARVPGPLKEVTPR
jgi:tRNA threonylcarbamoyladenosine biosynthesis protein TsaB